MSASFPHRIGRHHARHAYRRALLDAAAQAADRAAHAREEYHGLSRPKMNRQERVIFTLYVAMGVLIAAFLVATGVVWWLTA
jgi:hypothetical protein